MYFSTAYVAGKREGDLLETELIRPEGFKNHYEETKFEAERLVENIKNEVPLRLLDPVLHADIRKQGKRLNSMGLIFL